MAAWDYRQQADHIPVIPGSEERDIPPEAMAGARGESNDCGQFTRKQGGIF